MKPTITLGDRLGTTEQGPSGYWSLHDPRLGYAPMCGFNTAYGAAIWGTARGYTVTGFGFLHAFLEPRGIVRVLNARMALNDLRQRDGIDARQEQPCLN